MKKGLLRKLTISGILLVFLGLLSIESQAQVTDSCEFRANVVKKLTKLKLVPNVEVSPAPGRFYGYVEYKPVNYDPAKKYGLIIFFHGMSGRGDGSANNYKVGLCNILEDSWNTIVGISDGLADGKVLPDYILENYIIFTPQFNTYTFNPTNPALNDYPNDRNVEDAIDFAFDLYGNIDPNALVLMGMSSGGNMVAQYISSSVQRANRVKLSVILSNCTVINQNPVPGNAAQVIAGSTTQTYFVGCLQDATCSYNLSTLGWVNQINALNPANPAVLNTISTSDSCFSGSHNTWTHFFSPTYKGAPGGLNIYEYMEITAAVPVNLKSFNVRLVDNSVKIDWVTTQEQNNDYFIVERAGESHEFEEIGRVKGKGNSTVEQNYALIDPKPRLGINYYRLVQVDLDNKRKIYPIKTILNTALGKNAVISPNPFNDKLSVYLNLPASRKLSIYLTDMNGRKLISQQQVFREGSQEVQLNTSGLQRGMYFLRIEGEGISESQKVIKR